MLHIQKELSSQELTSDIFSANSIFFDIETTGLSSISSIIYLIGCMYQKENMIVVEQFFAETKEDEKELLEQFICLVENYQTLITFNGTRFDLPFICSRCAFYGISESFDKFAHIDIFKEAKNLKHLLNLPNYKQKTLETFLGIEREDKYSGGELIAIYEEYLNISKYTHLYKNTDDTIKFTNTTNPTLLEKNSSFHKNNDRNIKEIRSCSAQKLLELLLLHNFEDVTGMLDLLPIFTYRSVLNDGYQIEDTEISTFTTYEGKEKQELLLTLKNDYTVPKRISFSDKDFYITMYENTTKIRQEIFNGELKYFYENYKDYFYLPIEDMAIHKNVAAFVDKAHKQKAKACNCYTRKSGQFLSQMDTIFKPVFKTDYKNKVNYFELTEEFLNSKELLHKYIQHIFSHF